MAEDYITMTGKEFNEEYGKYEFIKVLRRDLTHHDYVYKPNALNKLRGVFNPNPDCMPDGLYFCKSKHIFTWIEVALFASTNKADPSPHPLIAKVEIPDDAIISVGSHKFKTDKLILGQPVEINEYITNEWILKRSSKKIKQMLSYCYDMMEVDLLKKVYPLCSVKHKIKPASRLRILRAVIVGSGGMDTEFMAYVLRDMDVTKMSRSNYSVELYNMMCEFVVWIVNNGYVFAMECCIKEGVPFCWNNNRLLEIARRRDDWQMLKLMVGAGFKIDSTITDKRVIDTGVVQVRKTARKTPTLLETALEERSISHAKKLVKLGAQLSKVSLCVKDHLSNNEKFAPFILANSLFSILENSLFSSESE